jgi:hypothetical protein
MKMEFDNFELTTGTIMASVFIVMVVILSAFIGSEAWRSSEKAAAYRAYVECLHETKAQPIDIQQIFCGRIRDQL